ncbi:MAG TPA: hypothetical protein VJV21_07425 [Pyrinomonadaceae bacterium]|nr:hypothetical protein [Pyrinomonadaceae bacterium]
MKKILIGITVTLAVVLFTSSTLSGQQNCRCIRDCAATRDRQLNALARQRAAIEARRDAALLRCLTRQCRIEAENNAQTAIGELERPANQAFEDCQRACMAAHIECRASITVNRTEFEVDCLDGRDVCMVPVSKFCQLATDSCGDCRRSMCGGEWTIASEFDLTTTLIAVDPTKNRRVLAKSSLRGNQPVLQIPAGMKLDGAEELYFEFGSAKELKGQVKVTIQRPKK